MRREIARNAFSQGLFTLALAAGVAGCGGPETGGAGATSGGGPGGTVHPGGSSSTACSVTKGAIAVSSGPGTVPAIAGGGDRFLVAWVSTTKDAGDIHAAVVDAKGAPQVEQTIAAGPEQSSHPAVVRLTAGGYLVLWEDAAGAGSVVRGRRVGDDGAPSGAAFEIAKSASAESRPSGAPLPTNTGIVWGDGPDAFLGLVLGGALIGKNPIPQASSPAIAASGGTLGLTWVAGAKLEFATVSDPLGPLAPATVRAAAAGTANVPRVADAGGGAFDVVWEDNRGGTDHETIFLSRVGKDGKPGPELQVPTDPGSANYPDVVSTGANTAVVYYQFQGGPAAVYLALFGSEQKRLSPDLQVSADKVAARYPRVARAGGQLGVAYAETGGLVRMALVGCP